MERTCLGIRLLRKAAQPLRYHSLEIDQEEDRMLWYIEALSKQPDLGEAVSDVGWRMSVSLVMRPNNSTCPIANVHERPYILHVLSMAERAGRVHTLGRATAATYSERQARPPPYADRCILRGPGTT